MALFQLAQINVARLLEPLDSPRLHGFVANLDRINALAEASPAFVWRLVGEGNDATTLRPFDDELIIVNMSVWSSLDGLKEYVYRGAHVEMLRQRRDWFALMGEMHMALWWVPAGHRPSVVEGRERLGHLRQHGSSAHAFSFRVPFAAPATPSSAIVGSSS